MRSLLFWSCLVFQSLAFADAVMVTSYQDFVDQPYQVDMTKKTICHDSSAGVNKPELFDRIQLLPNPEYASSAFPSQITKIDVHAFLGEGSTKPVFILTVDLRNQGSIYWDPNQSGDPILQFDANGTDQNGKFRDVACMSAY